MTHQKTSYLSMLLSRLLRGYFTRAKTPLANINRMGEILVRLLLNPFLARLEKIAKLVRFCVLFPEDPNFKRHHAKTRNLRWR